jgi:hypothetical protein
MRSFAMSCQSMCNLHFSEHPIEFIRPRADKSLQGPLRPSSRRDLLPDAARALRSNSQRRSWAYVWRGGGAGGCVLDRQTVSSCACARCEYSCNAIICKGLTVVVLSSLSSQRCISAQSLVTEVPSHAGYESQSRGRA